MIYMDSSMGYALLEHSDPGMGIAHGPFYPSKRYLDVRAVFQKFAEAQGLVGAAARERMREYYSERDQLGLQLKDDEGSIVPTSWIHIVDLGESAEPTPDDELTLEAAISDPAFFTGA